MEPLFRLMLRRPPIVQDPENPSIPTTQDSPLQKALIDASTGENPRDAMQQIARKYVTGSDFLGTAEANPLYPPLKALATALDVLAGDGASHNKVVKAIKDAFGRSPQAVIDDGATIAARRRLRDTLVVIKLLPEEHGRPIEALTNQLRDLELIFKVAGDADFPASAETLQRYRRRSLSLPAFVALKSVLSTEASDKERRKLRAEAEAARQKQVETLLATHQGLTTALRELASLGGEHLQATPQVPHAGFTPPPDLSAARAAARASAYYQRLTDLNLKQMEKVETPTGPAEPMKLADVPVATGATALTTQLLVSAPRPPAGSPAFRPLSPDEVSFRPNADAVNALSPATREVLAQRGVTLDQTRLDTVVRGLQTELRDAASTLGTLHHQAMTQSVIRVGETTVTLSRPAPSVWTDIFVGGVLAYPWVVPPTPLPPLPIPPESIPHTRGTVTPAGIADLLIIKQQLIGYETADISHIENVLKGESKVREHTTKQEIQQITFQETETTKSEERELQSTDRFEMTRETSSTIKEDAALKAGLTLSGKYGPSVDFSASAEGSTSRSKEEATKSAASYSQEVTQRSANKVTERVLHRTSLTVTNSVKEQNTHTLDNIHGNGHISGVYQWVNKVYRAQMFNYGLRTMFDFMVPEPAAFFIAAQKVAEANASSLQKPIDFSLTPDQVQESNYPYWVRVYQATDVTPPPEVFITKSFDFKAGGGDEDTDYNHSGQITIDEGYQALQGTVGRVVNTWGDEDLVDVIFGRHKFRYSHDTPWIWITPLDAEVGSIPFAMDTFKVSMIAIAVEVQCQRTERAMNKWRYETHAKLTSAYQARLAEYEEKLAAAKLQAGIPIQGKNPALNLTLMKDELKKHCISIITDQSYDLFDAIEMSASNGLPQINVAEAALEGAYVRFFEQAFEWEEITWVTYPYFWGRKNQWVDRLGYEDPDPLFNEFLKAGFCRVAVPARPGFEGAIDHFINFGELWNGGPLPPISSPLYLPIADEIAERLQRPGDEVPEGDPWQVRIPTTLVKLRADDALPRWKQNQSGEWVEA